MIFSENKRRKLVSNESLKENKSWKNLSKSDFQVLITMIRRPLLRLIDLPESIQILRDKYLKTILLSKKGKVSQMKTIRDPNCSIITQLETRCKARKFLGAKKNTQMKDEIWSFMMELLREPSMWIVIINEFRLLLKILKKRKTMIDVRLASQINNKVQLKLSPFQTKLRFKIEPQQTTWILCLSRHQILKTHKILSRFRFNQRWTFQEIWLNFLISLKLYRILNRTTSVNHVMMFESRQTIVLSSMLARQAILYWPLIQDALLQTTSSNLFRRPIRFLKRPIWTTKICYIPINCIIQEESLEKSNTWALNLYSRTTILERWRSNRNNISNRS